MSHFSLAFRAGSDLELFPEAPVTLPFYFVLTLPSFILCRGAEDEVECVPVLIQQCVLWELSSALGEEGLS